jgi:hypothetical protein
MYYLHTYFGTSAMISIVDAALTELPAFAEGLPSTITLPTPQDEPSHFHL